MPRIRFSTRDSAHHPISDTTTIETTPLAKISHGQ
jgi:hypothetical protein